MSYSYKASIKFLYNGEVIFYNNFDNFISDIINTIECVGPYTYEVKFYNKKWKKLYFEFIDDYF